MQHSLFTERQWISIFFPTYATIASVGSDLWVNDDRVLCRGRYDSNTHETSNLGYAYQCTIRHSRNDFGTIS